MIAGSRKPIGAPNWTRAAGKLKSETEIKLFWPKWGAHIIHSAAVEWAPKVVIATKELAAALLSQHAPTIRLVGHIYLV